jgi:hypothetical protein
MCLCLIWPQIAKCQSDTDKDAALELTQNRLIKVLGEVVITGPLPSNHADSAYLVLKQKLEKKNFLVRKLAHFLTPSCTMEPVKNSDFESSEFYFANFEGHPIRNIVIKKIAVFGTDMNDSTKHPFLLVDRLGNKIHYNTRDFVIRNNLLVKKGDRVNPYQMAYNEHVIRELPFIQDVKFELVRASVLSDSVDLVVKTKDMWSIGINYEPYNLNEHRLTISNQNLFGLGRTLTTKLLMKEHNAIGIGNKYSIGNFYGLFLNIELELENSFERRYGGITFDRSILNPGIKWLYGGGIKREEMNNNIVFEGNEFPNFQLDFQNYDLWFGYVKK